jgi:hypothetical protein
MPHLVADAQARQNNHRAHQGGADGFRPTMAVRMFRVGGHPPDLVSEQDDAIGEQVGKRVDGIGNQRCAVAQQAASKFDR